MCLGAASMSPARGFSDNLTTGADILPAVRRIPRARARAVLERRRAPDLVADPDAGSRRARPQLAGAGGPPPQR